MSADSKQNSGQPPPRRNRLRACDPVCAILFGLLFAVVVIPALYVAYCFDWWRYSEWAREPFSFWEASTWVYDRGGFPCIGVFAITSASYIVMRVLPCRFVTALLLVSGGSIVCLMVAGSLEILPRTGKSGSAHWQRPEFIGWLLIPPWIIATAIAIVRWIIAAAMTVIRLHRPRR
jgi:hypothetical protein